MRRAIGVLAIWISSLNHETRNDAVKCRPIVKSFLGKLDKVRYVTRRDIRKELEHNLPHRLSLAGHRNRRPHLLTYLSHSMYPFFKYSVTLEKETGVVPPRPQALD